MALVLDPSQARHTPPPRRARRGSAKVVAIAAAVALHALLLLVVLLARTPSPVAERPPAELELPAPTPPPFVPPRRTSQHRAGGSPATAPKLARPSTPVPKPSRVPPQPIRAPAPVPTLAVPAPTILAPHGPDLASPVTGAGEGAATGGSGAGTGTGPGGPGGHATVEPTWVLQPDSDIVERFYPPAAYKAGRPGGAELACTELADGRVKACRVLSETPLGDGFGAAAAKLSRWFRFRPVQLDGRPVEAPIVIPYDFSVDG